MENSFYGENRYRLIIFNVEEAELRIDFSRLIRYLENNTQKIILKIILPRERYFIIIIVFSDNVLKRNVILEDHSTNRRKKFQRK